MTAEIAKKCYGPILSSAAILLPLHPAAASLIHKNPQRLKIIHGMPSHTMQKLNNPSEHVY